MKNILIKMKKFLDKIQSIKFIIPLFLLVGFGLWPGIANAGVAEWAVMAVGKLIGLYVSAIGWIVLLLVDLLISIAQYNDFVNSQAITQGWVIVRDIVNMFFIVILLVIAFATIFNIEEYKYQKLLPRLLIMAIVINFSRTIAGLLIDFGQIVMITFVNGFQAAAGGNFVNALRINELLSFDETAVKGSAEGIELKYVFVGFLLAAIMISVTFVVVLAMLFMLIMRIVALWFLVVLSPIAFLASVWPSGKVKQKYALWWDMFIDNIMIGPILAFFLWLSLLVLGQGTIANDFKVTGQGIDTANKPRVGLTKAGTAQGMISYLMGIGMLIGSLYMTKNMSAAGKGVAGFALNSMQKYSKAALSKTASATYKRATYETRGARAKLWSGVGNIPLVKGMVGGFALKRAAKLQSKQQKEAKERSDWTSGLTENQKDLRLKQLRKGPLSSKGRADRAELEKWKLNRVLKNKPKNDAEYQEAKQQFNISAEFLKANEGYAPDYKEKLKDILKTRPDLIMPKIDMEIAAKSLGSLEATQVNPDSYRNKDFVASLDKKVRESVKKGGGALRRELIEQWEAKNVSNKEDVDSIDLNSNEGENAKEIASSSNEELKSRVRAERRDDYKAGLNASMNKPGDHIVQRRELLALGEDPSKLYKIDTEGDFEDEKSEKSFTSDIMKDKGMAIKIIANKDIQGEAKNLALDGINIKSLLYYAKGAKTNEQKEDLRGAIKEIIELSQKGGATGKLKDLAKEIENNPRLSVLREEASKQSEDASAQAKKEGPDTKEEPSDDEVEAVLSKAKAEREETIEERLDRLKKEGEAEREKG